MVIFSVSPGPAIQMDGTWMASGRQAHLAGRSCVGDAQAAGDRLPSYVTREQARASINAAATTSHRLLLETHRQSGGRVTEVLRLRRAISISANRSCTWSPRC